MKPTGAYQGFEQGPIRPPSEAYSLLIRVTRNCPWNRCAFCPVYKGRRFSLRPVEHVLRDIDTIHRLVASIREKADAMGHISREALQEISAATAAEERNALNAALNWLAGGMSAIFLQDANSLIIKPADLVRILAHLKSCFPWVARITSYARSHTIARIADDDLAAMQQAGLNRIHIGLESGSDAVLKLMKKGITQKGHITAGLKVIRAGMELSEYVMPGLGGKALSNAHALQTAEALNQINPHFIRLRSLAIPAGIDLHELWTSGAFEKCTDIETAEEILLFLENLDGITSNVKSDHILNLFEDVEGTLPKDKAAMMDLIRSFLALPAEKRTLYQVGRRLGMFRRLSDLQSPENTARAEAACRRFGITPQNVDRMIDELMTRFI